MLHLYDSIFIQNLKRCNFIKPILIITRLCNFLFQQANIIYKNKSVIKLIKEDVLFIKQISDGNVFTELLNTTFTTHKEHC